jgi:hypothetical protein
VKVGKNEGNMESLEDHTGRLSSNKSSYFSHLVRVLGVLEKVGEAAFGFFISICLSVRIQQLGFHYIFRRSGI